MFSAFSNLFPGNIGCKNKNPSQRISERNHVLRTGIEPYMIISKLPYLQAELQAVKDDFLKICNLHISIPFFIQLGQNTERNMYVMSV